VAVDGAGMVGVVFCCGDQDQVVDHMISFVQFVRSPVSESRPGAPAPDLYKTKRPETREALHRVFAFPQGLKPRLLLQSLTYGLKPVPFKTATCSEVR
jgi:hypothetical protein